MKKEILTALSMLLIATSATVGAAIPTIQRIKKNEARIVALEEKEPQKPYVFDVKEHVIAILTSEVQETTHDMYLAHCVRGANDCFIEVPVNDTRDKLDLVYTGYEITYTIDRLLDRKVSNKGWELV